MNNCPGNIHAFCYVCGKFVKPQNRRKISLETAALYEQYFNLPVIRDVDWAPRTICTSCNNSLVRWSKRLRIKMCFGVPMIWMNPQNHFIENCYVCTNKFSKLNSNKSAIYKSVSSAQLPQPHSENIPIPKCPSPTGEYILQTFTSTTYNEVKVYGYHKRQEDLLEFFENNSENTSNSHGNHDGLKEIIQSFDCTGPNLTHIKVECDVYDLLDTEEPYTLINDEEITIESRRLTNPFTPHDQASLDFTPSCPISTSRGKKEISNEIEDATNNLDHKVDLLSSEFGSLKKRMCKSPLTRDNFCVTKHEFVGEGAPKQE